MSENELAAFADGGVPTQKGGGERIEAHLAQCGECRVVFAQTARAKHSHLDRVAVDSFRNTARMTSDTDAELLAVGQLVGRYVIAGVIGRGAMGVVYAANDPDLDRKVAVKVLRADSSSESARHRMGVRLLREAKAMARLSHPEVMTIYEVGVFAGQIFIAMEHVDGETLRRWRASQHRGHAEILAVYERAGSGLAAAHDVGLVHRDFKPDNVLIGRDGRVRVTDFGLARRLDEVGRAETSGHEEERAGDPGLTTLTGTGTLVGTPAYMAPEQLRGGAADARSDVFGFCVSLYEALYGERPFAGATVVQLQAAIDAEAVRAAPVMTRVPRWVRAVLLRGLRAKPDDRFASMRALLDALRAEHARSRRRASGVAAGALVVLALGVAVMGRTASRAAARETSAMNQGAGAIPTAQSAAPPIAHDAPPLAPASATDVGAEESLPASRPTGRPPRAIGRAEPAIAEPSHSPVAAKAVQPTRRSSPIVGTNGAFILDD